MRRSLLLPLLLLSTACSRQDARELLRDAARAVEPPPARSRGGFHSLRGRVVAISDGDTLTVLDADHVQHKIRLLGIDTPEKAQMYGKVARQVLSDRVFGREVDVQTRETDRYKRELGKVLLGGVDQNLAMIQEGLAWHYAHYASSQFPGDAERYARAEQAARREGLGLWRDGNPVPPWEWRRNRKRGGRGD